VDNGVKKLWVAGEALIDLIPVATGAILPMVGGGPANTAKALARLGYSTFFIGGLSSDLYGKMIKEELKASGVDLSLAYRGDRVTALAIASIDEKGLASYKFELEGSSSFAFNGSWLPGGEPGVIHIGSVATLLEPGASELFNWAKDKSAPIVFDPNIRPSIESDKKIYREAVERFISIAAVVKLSEDDLTWLYKVPEGEVITNWLSRGTEIVVVTRAERGLSAFTRDGRIDCPAAKVKLVDSVGAGDTIGAVIVEGLLKHGLGGLNQDVLRQVLERAAIAAGITCSRAGANPPWKEELDLAL
jgi:fructokinase